VKATRHPTARAPGGGERQRLDHLNPVVPVLTLQHKPRPRAHEHNWIRRRVHLNPIELAS
jgi:hypothetical protein